MKPTEVIGDCELYLGDCLEVIPTLGKVDAAVTDPPYYMVKADEWDNQWKSEKDFLLWARDIGQLLQRCVAKNGSVYWFASPQMASRVEVELRSLFNVRNHIVWDKSGGRKGVGGTGIDVTSLRCFWSANTERLIFAEQYGSDDFADGESGYSGSCVSAKTSIFGEYLKAEFKRAGVTNRQIAELFPSKTGGLTGCVSNWILGLNVPTEEQYQKIRTYLNDRHDDHYLDREYEDLKEEYEELRRPFNVSPSDQWGDIWQFSIERSPKHPTQKPISLMVHIVKTSTRTADVVLDPFMGSGTTGVACAKLGRKFIGIELNQEYFDIACKRIEEAYKQPDLFIEQPTKKPDQMTIEGLEPQ